MKKINLAAMFLILSAFGSAVYADVALQSKEEVEGTWKLQSTKNSLNDKQAIDREDTWVFKMYDDGGLIWQQTFGNRGLDKATGIAEGKDGNYGITGITSSGKGSRNIWLFVLNKEGKRWDMLYMGILREEWMEQYGTKTAN